MIKRVVLTQPLETIALDIVGPVSQGKGRSKFILTVICMATRWPEAIVQKSRPLKSHALCRSLTHRSNTLTLSR